MRCPKCRADNLADSLFCTECGARIEAGCAACGATNPPGARFCRKCGAPVAAAAPARAPAAYTPRHLAERILTTRSALEGERKQVTVLFADVRGSMELAEQVHAEAWHAILDRFFAILAEGVHRFEGTVNQYTGDGIMALFGAPIAHEDHAHRACYAALHLREALRGYAHELRRERGLNFAVRMGLNSGEVVVGRIGDDLRMDYTAQGYTVGLAARMQELAEPGKVYVTERTAAIVAGYFRLDDLGAFTLKGAREPAGVFDLQGMGALRTRLDVSRARGFSRFVGRTAETAALEAALERALAGAGQVVGIVGEAGLGKSRLCFEFAERCRARGLRVYEGHGVAHGKAMPFLPVLELLRSYFGVVEQDDARTAREKIAGRLLLLDPALTESLPLLFDFLGVPDPERPALRLDPEARQRQLFAVTRRLIQAANRREPGLLLFEDLHWLDGASEAFLANHVEALAGSAGLLLVNFRPEYRAAWMQRSYYQQIPLTPLGPEAIADLLGDLLGADPSLAGLSERIRERTAGNPFFTEEVVQGLVESGRLVGLRGAYRLAGSLDEVAIPATVQAILAARIDRLGEREKEVLQTAAVIGREFAEPVLRRVAGQSEDVLAAALRALVGAEFLYEGALYPEAEYSFKHPLTQEVAYASQLAERRARVHGAVARVVHGLYADRLDERAALLAHHWEGAGDALEAARWHRRAAEWAGVSDPAGALPHWERVRALLGAVPESAETVALGLTARFWLLQVGWRLGVTAEEAATLFAEGRALAERNHDLRQLALILMAYGPVRGVAGDVEGYLEISEEAARVAVQADDAGLELAAQTGLIYSYFIAGRLRQALAFAEAAVASSKDDPQRGADVFTVSPHLFCLWWRGNLRASVGRPHDTAHDLDRVLRLAREQGEIETQGWVHGSYIILAEYTGEAGGVLDHARQQVEIAERTGSSFSRAFAYRMLGQAHLLCNQWGEAIASLEQALAISHERRVALEQEPLMLAHLAQAAAGAGHLARARAAADEAIALARRLGARFMECQAYVALARVLLRTDGAASREAIESALTRALELVEETGGAGYEPFIRLERAELARLAGDEAARRHELRLAQRLFTEMGATAHVTRLAAAAGEAPTTAPGE